MKDFPEFMKNEKNHISSNQQFCTGIDGYYFRGHDGSQMAFWTCYENKTSKKHKLEFDEYVVCVCGQYTVYMDGMEFVLDPGEELFIPGETEQISKYIAGTRTIHAFSGERITK